MKRMKTFFKYFVIFLIVYVVVDFLSLQTMKSSYRNKNVTIESQLGQIDIYESKATVTNGTIKGKVTNNTGEDWKGKILKLDFISKHGNSVGTKYVNIGDLANGQSKEFVSNYNFDNVDSVKTSIEDQASLGDLGKLDFSLDDLKLDRFPWYVWLAAAIMVWG